MAFIGVFTYGQYRLMLQKYSRIAQIPQMEDWSNVTMRKVCGITSTNSMAIVDPSGNLVEITDKTFNYVSGHPDQNWIDHHILSEERKSWIVFPYRDFKDLPTTLAKLPDLLKYGRFAEAYKLALPYAASDIERFKQAADKTLAMVGSYQVALLTDIKALADSGDIGEAYRLAAQALIEFKGIPCEFTGKLEEFVKAHAKDDAVKATERARQVFEAGMKYLEKGKTEYAVKYFENVAKSSPDTWYGKRAQRMLEYL